MFNKLLKDINRKIKDDNFVLKFLIYVLELFFKVFIFCCLILVD